MRDSFFILNLTVLAAISGEAAELEIERWRSFWQRHWRDEERIRHGDKRRWCNSGAMKSVFQCGGATPTWWKASGFCRGSKWRQKKKKSFCVFLKKMKKKRVCVCCYVSEWVRKKREWWYVLGAWSNVCW